MEVARAYDTPCISHFMARASFAASFAGALECFLIIRTAK